MTPPPPGPSPVVPRRDFSRTFGFQDPHPPGTCFNFHSGRGGGTPPPWTPSPPPLDPLPPLPPQLKCTRKPGFWKHFLVMGKHVYGRQHDISMW